MKPHDKAVLEKASKLGHEFDLIREKLANECNTYRAEGLSYRAIAAILNGRGQMTKTGRAWTTGNVLLLIQNPKPPQPKPESKAAKRRNKAANRKIGVTKLNDKEFNWVTETYPHLEKWRRLGETWVKEREQGIQHAIQGVGVLIEFIDKNQLSSEPSHFLLASNTIPDFHNSIWGAHKTHSSIMLNNTAHFFIKWVLSQQEFCEEDDNGQLCVSPVFQNPIPHLSRTGIPRHPESVRTTLPYVYIEEIRLMIAQGPNFSDWKWAHRALGLLSKKSTQDTHDSIDRIAPIWFEVDRALVDETDPDCVWRERSRAVGSKSNGTTRYKTIIEMWSPVRWVALLLKLQLPLRTFQVRMLDSGEADTWRWEKGKWIPNTGVLAKGSPNRPYSNGVFLKPVALSDIESMVLLYVNTNKTADIGKEGNQRGYTVPWMMGGKLHQDPYYWLEKLRRWQEKYNPITRLTKWSELDGRHIPAKSTIQLASYPDTAFLFRTPETPAHRDYPLTMTALNTPWYWCLYELENRLADRSETLPSGGRICFLPQMDDKRAHVNSTTFFPLHALRVSLITALALDGEVPLAILQKIAGHSRLVMTLYYTKPGATQTQESLRAGVDRLNNIAGESSLDWLANTEYTQLVREAITNSLESFKAAVPELPGQRTPAGWMVMLDGICLVGGNNSEPDSPGCHNGGPNIGSDSAPRYAPVPGGARNCPRCRWFVTRPSFLPHLAARWNNMMYHCNEARAEVIRAEDRFLELENLRADALNSGRLFTQQSDYQVAQRVREQSIQLFDELVMTIAAITRLIERCRVALNSGDGTALVAGGNSQNVEFAIQEVDSELLQLSGVCEGTEIYPDLMSGKAVLRRSQLLDAALQREDIPPVFLMLSEQEQMSIGNAFTRQLSIQMNPSNPSLGKYQVISLIDASKSLSKLIGIDVSAALEEAKCSTALLRSSNKS